MSAATNIAASLDGLRSSFAGCTAIAFADISTGLVLSTSAAARQPQETYDALCARAMEIFDGDGQEIVSAAFPGSSGQPMDEALYLSGQSVQVFLRSRSDATEALCCICRPEIDIDRFATKARAVLDSVAEGA